MTDNPGSSSSRSLPLDALRGTIIILMALDHANYFVAQRHSPGEYWGGAFPVYADALTFLARLATHPAAPGFFLLMGAGMALFARSRRLRGWSEWQIVRHFVIRGTLLIALQLLIVNRAWELSPQGWEPEIYLGVLVALGGTMMLGSLLLRLKPLYLLALAAILFVGTELIHPHPSQWGDITNDALNLILTRPGGTPSLWSNYPVLPWLELVILGMAFGHWVASDPQRAYGLALKFGTAFLLAFLVIRYLDGFGNIRPRTSDNWIGWLNPVKYPPSMTFTLMTTGANLILLWLFSRAGERGRRLLQPLAVLGRVPLFFYVLHLFLYAGLGYLLAPGGTSIPAMIPVWLLGLAILLPLCWWYGRLKQRQPANSLLRYF